MSWNNLEEKWYHAVAVSGSVRMFSWFGNTHRVSFLATNELARAVIEKKAFASNLTRTGLMWQFFPKIWEKKHPPGYNKWWILLQETSGFTKHKLQDTGYWPAPPQGLNSILWSTWEAQRGLQLLSTHWQLRLSEKLSCIQWFVLKLKGSPSTAQLRAAPGPNSCSGISAVIAGRGSRARTSLARHRLLLQLQHDTFGSHVGRRTAPGTCGDRWDSWHVPPHQCQPGPAQGHQHELAQGSTTDTERTQFINWASWHPPVLAGDLKGSKATPASSGHSSSEWGNVTHEWESRFLQGCNLLAIK